MQLFSDEIQKAGFKGYLGGLATALALWGFSIDGLAGKVMVAIAVVTIFFLLFGSKLTGGDER